jgi:hypothetical protein
MIDMSVSIPPLLSMAPAQLDDLYRHSPAGAIPNGVGEGVAILLPGTPLARSAAKIVRLLFWQGKVFDAPRGELRNRITIFRVLAVRARAYTGMSLLDGNESIILDYSRTSLLARWVRDEMREVAPGLYLGLAYVFNIRLIAFALFFRDRPTHGQ